MMERRGFVLAALVVVCPILFVAAPYAQAGGWQPWSRLEGTWLRTSLDENGDPAARSIYVMSPKGPFAREAAVRLTFINPNPLVVQGLGGPNGYVTDAIGEAVMTGPSTFKATAYTYIMAPQDFPLRAKVVAILVGTTTSRFVNEDLIEGEGTGLLYPASADADGDLIPDPGSVPYPLPPVIEVFTDKRTPMVP